MSLRQDAKLIAERFKEFSGALEKNAELLDIQEGNLLFYVERDLKEQLSENAFKEVRDRIPPINVQKRVVDKLSQIYGKPPTRKIGDTATERDKEMWDNYLKQFKIDDSGTTLNTYFNLHKSCAWEPYLDSKFKPRLRSIPKDRFFVMGEDPTDPLRVTHFIKVMGKKSKGETVHVILYCYTDTEFLIIYDDGEVATDMMAAKKVDGHNPFGVIPYVYLNRSQTKINAPQDSDMYRMVTLIPILFADINYALKFQAFSIFYGINVDKESIPMNPNTFINLKSSAPGLEPSLGTIKPDVDSDKALTAVMEQLSLWLQSRNIRPGTVGKSNGEANLTGVSKMIDEMDTTGDRQRQIPYFTDGEEALFNLVAYHMHPVWSKNPSFKEKAQFTKELEYAVKFPEQVSWQTRQEVLAEVKLERDLGIVSKRTAMQRVNPEMSEAEIDEELARIKEEQGPTATDEEIEKNPTEELNGSA